MVVMVEMVMMKSHSICTENVEISLHFMLILIVSGCKTNLMVDASTLDCSESRRVLGSPLGCPESAPSLQSNN